MTKAENRSVRDYAVKRVERSTIAAFIEKWHYSGSINGCVADYCFALYDKNVMIGAMFYGRMAMAGQWKRFVQKESDVIELRRLCCVDATPKNTESFFIGATLRWLSRNTTHKVVVSYADAEHGHTGVIYRASNFVLEGRRPGAKVIQYQGKRYHDKSIRSKHNGNLKPFAQRLIQALQTGEATYEKTAGKFCYTFALRGARRPKQLGQSALPFEVAETEKSNEVLL